VVIGAGVAAVERFGRGLDQAEGLRSDQKQRASPVPNTAVMVEARVVKEPRLWTSARRDQW
jgi:hypothetical protein